MLPVPYLFSMQDKLIHAAAYAVMALIFWNAGYPFVQSSYRLPLKRLALLVVVFCMLYGASDEWHQSFVSGRDASLFDWLADSIGALLLTLTLSSREVIAIGRK